MRLLFFFIIIFTYGNVYSEKFPEIYGCFCEGGIITGKISSKDNLQIDKKKLKFLKTEDLFLHLEENLKII